MARPGHSLWTLIVWCKQQQIKRANASPIDTPHFSRHTVSPLVGGIRAGSWDFRSACQSIVVALFVYAAGALISWPLTSWELSWLFCWLANRSFRFDLTGLWSDWLGQAMVKRWSSYGQDMVNMYSNCGNIKSIPHSSNLKLTCETPLVWFELCGTHIWQRMLANAAAASVVLVSTNCQGQTGLCYGQIMVKLWSNYGQINAAPNSPSVKQINLQQLTNGGTWDMADKYWQNSAVLVWKVVCGGKHCWFLCCGQAMVKLWSSCPTFVKLKANLWNVAGVVWNMWNCWAWWSAAGMWSNTCVVHIWQHMLTNAAAASVVFVKIWSRSNAVIRWSSYGQAVVKLWSSYGQAMVKLWSR